MKALGDKTILYYEDQQDKVRTILEMLTIKLGLTVLLAETPSEARDAVEKRNLDLILLDIRIRGDNQDEDEEEDWRRRGLYFLRDLRAGKLSGATPADIPVLVITGVVNTADVDEILKAGNANNGRCRYLAKPVRLEPVEREVRDLIG